MVANILSPYLACLNFQMGRGLMYRVKERIDTNNRKNRADKRLRVEASARTCDVPHGTGPTATL